MTFDPSLHPLLGNEESMLVRTVSNYTREYFEDPRFDASHDFDHVLRVTAIACKILEQESNMNSSGTDSPCLSTVLVILGALLHDVGDKKYVDTSSDTYIPLVKQKLVEFGASEDVASKIQLLVDAVSFSSEKQNPQRVRDVLILVPELAVVQDADRLDAMGAIGIGRCFVFGAVRGARHMNNSIDHFDDKLLKLESMMKTASGAALAAKYAERLRTFKSWWEDELWFAN